MALRFSAIALAFGARLPTAISYIQRMPMTSRHAVFSLRRTLLQRASTQMLSTEAGAQLTGYDHGALEAKWQLYWEQHRTFLTRNREGKEKKYVLDMFPYPSGTGLHVGHPEGYTASDIMARYWRMCDYDVLHPMGWDAFGLPAEQHAITTGTHPEVTTKANIANFKRQLKSLGFSYDWERELSTTDEQYVRWTQWIFLQLYNRGLAFQSEVLVNWCPKLGTVLANEEIIDGLSERGGHPVVRQPLRQWVLKITAYAERLAADVEGLDWPEGTINMQQAWIGRSDGAYVSFEVDGDGNTCVVGGEEVRVFTTRPDTLMGATYVVLAPEHPLVSKLTTLSTEQAEPLTKYVAAAARRSDMDRTVSKSKTGVFSGVMLSHPLTGELLPLWVADYVLAGYGTGAVMAVPAHDERDFEFAKALNLPMKVVVGNADGSGATGGVALEEATTGAGVAINSGEAFDGLETERCKEAVVEALVAAGKGEKTTTYKLRDWVFSRQRYWGEPIPIVFPVTMEEEGGDPRDGDAHTIEYGDAVAVPEDELPVRLPELADFAPGDDPQGCLARCVDWRYFQKADGSWWARETNTMPQWAGSCWYYLRFADPANDNAFVSVEAEAAWLPVDLYVGGAEHAVLHLLYARFWHKVLHDLGLVSSAEPFARLVHQGMILGSDGEKMSKSRGNVINPDDIVSQYGADAMRLYEMFMGPLDAVKPWQTEQISGVVRFQRRIYGLVTRASAQPSDVPMAEETLRLMHQTIKKVSEDVEKLAFNTVISQLMVFSNHLQGLEQLPQEPVRNIVLMLSPFAPHLGEEAWQLLGGTASLAYESWPEYDEELCVESTITMAVQVNGKVRGEVTIEKAADEGIVEQLALAVPAVAQYTQGKEIKKFIYVPGKIVNVVIGK